VGASQPERIAENEVFLREVNERIAEKTVELAGLAAQPGEQQCDFLCACGQPDCTAIVSLTIAEFEHAQSKDDQFVIAHGHESPEIERVVEEHENYLVVKKRRGFKPEDLPDV
jgi:ethanolamine utilization microcompartment shell protein EutS